MEKKREGVSFLYFPPFAMWGARLIKCPPWQLWAVANCKFTQTHKKRLKSLGGRLIAFKLLQYDGDHFHFHKLLELRSVSFPLGRIGWG